METKKKELVCCSHKRLLSVEILDWLVFLSCICIIHTWDIFIWDHTWASDKEALMHRVFALLYCLKSYWPVSSIRSWENTSSPEPAWISPNLWSNTNIFSASPFGCFIYIKLNVKTSWPMDDMESREFHLSQWGWNNLMGNICPFGSKCSCALENTIFKKL